MDDQTKKFLESLKPGEYVGLTILVKRDSAERVIEVLKDSGLAMAVVENVQAALDTEFYSEDDEDKNRSTH